MKYLKVYEDFKDKDIDLICKKYNINNYTIIDGKVNVNGNVDLSEKNLTKLPLNFGIVTGHFYCGYNQLTTLEGAPKSVGGYFDCGNNKLTTLLGGPQSVGGNFNCYYNKLTTLLGAPQSVGGNFDCRNNQLTTLEYATDSLGGDFSCYNNPVNELYELFEDYSKLELFNYMDIVYEPEDNDTRPVIYLIKLNEFLKQINKPPIKSLKNYNCL